MSMDECTYSSDCDFNVNEEESDTSSKSTRTPSKDHVEVEDLPVRRSTKKKNPQRQLQCRGRHYERRDRRSTIPPQQIAEEKMAASQKEKERFQPWSENQRSACHSQRPTRSTTKAFTEEGSEKIYCIGTMPCGKGSHSQSKIIASEQSKGRRKGKPLRPVIKDVLIGKVTNAVADAEELRRKRAEDTIRCGRMLRVAGNAITGKSGLNAISNTSEESHVKRNPTAGPNPVQCQRLSPNLTALHRHVKNAGIEDTRENGRSEEALAVHAIVGKTSDAHSKKVLGTPSESYSTVPQSAFDESVSKEMNLEALEAVTEPCDKVDRYRHSTSPSIHSQDEHRGRRRWERQMLPTSGCSSENERCLHSDCAQRRAHRSSRREKVATKSPRKRRSTSPAYHSAGPLRKSPWGYKREDGTIELPGMTNNGARSDSEDKIKEGGHHRRRKLSWIDRRYEYDRSLSPIRIARQRRHSRSYSRSQSRSPSVQGEERGRKQAPKMEEKIPNDEKVVVSSSSIDRRTRRYKQAVREAEVARRNKEGKKAFYLTLDNEGRPHGPGRAAWVAHVNKLAIGLDPSCTHIRKQTYEDMCILKDRLNDNFEYSGDLNEDYLRGLLGKAVTRRRSELIALIKRGADQPKHFDKEVWKRLQNLAKSRQRESKEEQGRYASACRRTFGRTGPIGEEGVRERLRELRGRSPDYEEVAEEMQRDKGFGKTEELPIRGLRVIGDGSSREGVLEEEATHVHLKTSELEECRKGGNECRQWQLLRHAGIETNEQVIRRSRDNVETVPEGSRIEVENDVFVLADDVSKDDYIARMQAELRTLKGNAGSSSSSSMLWRYEVPRTGHHDIQGFPSAQRRDHRRDEEEYIDVEDFRHRRKRI